MPRLVESSQTRRILDFDIENRPLSYWFGDVTTGDITAIAWRFLDEDETVVRLLGVDTQEDMLEEFVAAYDAADMVTGHYIRKHDLPVLNGALFENGMRPLSPKLSHDTKLDLVKMKHLPSSQEALSEMLGIEAPKVGMSTVKWRAANRLSEAGIELTKARVAGDIEQHIQLREALLLRGMLRTPRKWYPVTGGTIQELIANG